jgi:hypothetical protein
LGTSSKKVRETRTDARTKIKRLCIHPAILKSGCEVIGLEQFFAEVA